MAPFSCAICREALSDGIFSSCYSCALYCGHVFHDHCIYNWLERSPTCPHCRVSASKEEMIKLFFNSSEENEVQDVNELKDEIEKLTALLHQTRSELKEKKNECYRLNEQVTSAHKINIIQKNEIKVLKNKAEELKGLRLDYNRQKLEARITVYALDAEKAKCQKLLKDLQKYKKIKELLDGSVDQADKIINSEESIDYESLKTCFMTIKRDFKVLAQSEEKLKKDYSALFSLHKTLEENNAALLEKCSIQERVIENYQSKSKLPVNETLPLNQSVQPMDIEESNLEPSSSKQGNLPRRSPRNKKKNIALSMGTKRTSSRQLSYDGLGGHSAVDIFPTAKLRACRIVSNRRK